MRECTFRVNFRERTKSRIEPNREAFNNRTMSEIYCTACKDKVTLHADATFACSCEGPINPLDGGDPIPETWEMHGGDTDVYHELRRGADVEKAYQKAE